MELATKIGLREAIILQHFYWWHEHNSEIPAMNIDGRVWFFLTISKIQDTFPYLSIQGVKTIVKNLIENGYKFKRTTWYSLTDVSIQLFHLPILTNGEVKINHEVNNIVNTTSSNEEDSNISIKPASFDFRKSLIALGVTPSTVDQWLLVRKKKGAVNTEAAFNTIAKEIAKAAPVTPEACIYKAVAESWRGFKADWLHEESPAQRKGNTTPAAPSAGAYPRPKHDAHLDVDFSQFYPQA